MKCPIVAARVRNSATGEELVINVALDTRSTDCWINPNLVSLLGLETGSCSTYLTTMHESRKRTEVGVVRSLVIGDLDSNKFTEIPFVYVKPDGTWPFSRHEVPVRNDIVISAPSFCSVPLCRGRYRFVSWA